jgi:hypothetical protein
MGFVSEALLRVGYTSGSTLMHLQPRAATSNRVDVAHYAMPRANKPSQVTFLVAACLLSMARRFASADG